MILYVMPQGSTFSRAVNDEQPLSPQGREQVQKTALAFKRQLLDCDYLLSGTAIAALESASIVALALGYPEDAVSCTDMLRPGVPVERLIAFMEEINRGASVFMVGPLTPLEHFLEAAMSWSVKGSLSMQPAGLTCIDLMSFTPIRGKLMWHLTPRQTQIMC